MEKVEINKQAKLSEHFTLGEMIKTRAKGLDNTPPHGAVLNLKNLCENWLEDLRYSYNLLYVVPTREGQSPCTPQASHTGDSPCVSEEVLRKLRTQGTVPVCRRSRSLLIADSEAKP